jgi:hypothetical protein
MIVFSGYDSTNDLIYGSNLRLFYLDHLAPLGSAFLSKFQQVYWQTIIKDEKEVKEKDAPKEQKEVKEKKLLFSVGLNDCEIKAVTASCKAGGSGKDTSNTKYNYYIDQVG